MLAAVEVDPRRLQPFVLKLTAHRLAFADQAQRRIWVKRVTLIVD